MGPLWRGSALNHTPLLWSVRIASALGLASLSLTGEIHPGYLIIHWTAWVLSYLLDLHPLWEERLKKFETIAVMGLIATFLLDFIIKNYSIFISVAHFLILFQTFKLLGLKTRKDCLQILIFSFFQILSACTLSVDAWHAIILLCLIPIGTAALFWQQISREEETYQQPCPASVRQLYHRFVTFMCIGAIPMNMALASAVFVIFPRLTFNPALARFAAGRSGYTEQVNLAQTGTLQTDNSTVLWLKITPTIERTQWNGYLRGSTLDLFDGKTWSRSRPGDPQILSADQNGLFRLIPRPHSLRAVHQTVTLVNTSGSTLFTSPYPFEIIAPLSALQYHFDGTLRWSTSWRKPLRYDVISDDMSSAFPGGLDPVSALSEEGIDYLQIPSIPLKNMTALSRKIGGSARSPDARAKATETYLRTHYRYSYNLGEKVSPNPVEDFLFVRKNGPCGHFASAMVLLLRLQRVPSRIVSGYLRGEWNTPAEEYLVRERDAHAWVEAYIEGKGWVPFDPSPRQTAALGASEVQRWLLAVRQYWDFLGLKWNRAIIEYDLYSQLRIVHDMQNASNRINNSFSKIFDRITFMHFTPSSSNFFKEAKRRRWNKIHAVAGVALASMALLLLREYHRKSLGATSTKDAIAFYQKFLYEMARTGFPKTPSETGLEFAKRLLETHPSPPPSAMPTTERYYQIRFASSHPESS